MGSHDSTDVLDDDKDLAPIDTSKVLDPHSAGYADEVVKALRLHDPEARRLRNLSREREQELEALIRRYAHTFLLAGAPLRALAGEAEGVEFEINTGDATPVYRPPFIRSPDQLRILKEEIQKMIELDVMEPVPGAVVGALPPSW
jgi:hypothetical protein